MKINNSGYNQYLEKIYKESKQSNVSKSEEDTAAFIKDRIELSDSSKEIKMYFDKIKDSSINMERVNTIKEAIRSGTYRISSEELADKIVQKMKE